jgi:hypothetical protein
LGACSLLLRVMLTMMVLLLRVVPCCCQTASQTPLSRLDTLKSFFCRLHFGTVNVALPHRAAHRRVHAPGGSVCEIPFSFLMLLLLLLVLLLLP